MIKKIVLILLSLYIVSEHISSQNPLVLNFEKKDYQGADKNWSITQDNNGTMYFGNDAGLIEYDGIEWTTYSLRNNSVVRSVCADNGVIYTGGFEEFGVWTRSISGELIYTSLSSNLQNHTFKNDDIWRIIVDKGKVYFQSFNSIFIYENDTIKIIKDKNILFLNKINDLFYIQEMGGSLYKLEDDCYKHIEGSEIFENTTVQAVLPYSNEQIIIVTSTEGLFLYNGHTFSKFSIKGDYDIKQINAAILFNNDRYYLGTLHNGIYVMSKDGTIIDHLNTSNYLDNNTILSLMLDQDNTIWVGLDKGIASIKYSNKLGYYLDKRNNLGAVYTACVYANKLFLGTNQGLFYTDYNNLSKIGFTLSSFKPVSSIKGQIWDLCVINNTLYCGQNEGVYTIDSQLNISKLDKLHTGVFDIVKSEDENAFLGTYTSLAKINLQNNDVSEFGLVKQPIMKVEVDHLDNIWLEHLNKGVYKCQLNSDKSKMVDNVYYSSESENNLPYKLHLFKIGGRASFLGDNKFFIYDDLNNKIKPYTILDNLFKGIEDLKKVFNIDKYNMWIVSDNILYKVYNNGHEATFKDKIDLLFDDISLVNNFEKIEVLNDSIDLICLDKGFILYHKNTSVSTPVLHRPIISSFGMYDSSLNTVYKMTSEKLTVPNNYNSIKIGFTSKEIIKNNLYFQYKLRESDSWSEPQKINKVIYERLLPGKYTFYLRTVDRLGNQSESIQIVFRVLYPWYKTLWAYIGYTLLLLALGFLTWSLVLTRYRNNHLRKIRERESKRLRYQNDKLQLVVKEKDAELLSQTSSIIQKNELIFKIKEELDFFNEKYTNKNFQPLFLKINTLLNNSLNSDEDWKSFLIKFEQKHSSFFKHLKNSYPDLTANDLKLCACLKLNLGSKEISSLMNISTRSIENNRSRLRKKLGLSVSQNLNDFLLSI